MQNEIKREQSLVICKVLDQQLQVLLGKGYILGRLSWYFDTECTTGAERPRARRLLSNVMLL